MVYLLKAWQSIPDRKGWQSTLAGNGPEREKLTGYPDVEILDFMDQSDLLKVMENSGAFILPSLFEPWALVLHEAACAGLPMLASTCCGVVASFLREGENGYLSIPGNIRSICCSIEKLIMQSDTDLLQMGRISRELGMKITPERVADTLLTVLK
ncbi:MAG: glycosyltransferase family 4 protein [Parabacteroides sp.]|nr:glycosyltransferase family 4 protein [Parabacteroides sp.]